MAEIATYDDFVFTPSVGSEYDETSQGNGLLGVKSLNRQKINDFSGAHDSGQLSVREISALINRFDVPEWGIKDYINERAAFQKQLYTIGGEPAWFYFKIFFKFDTAFGLFGNIFNGGGKEYYSDIPYNYTSAYNYLTNIQQRYLVEKPLDRRYSLEHFVKILSYISRKAPWFFLSIKNLDDALKYKLDKPYEQKSFTIEFMQEAVDMRVTSLFDLYRYAAFDFAHDKEIIPENLRKFDMDVVLFQTPLRYFQTSMKDLKNRTVKYKNLYDDDLFNRMSYQIFTFQNCEFDIESFASLIPSSMSNEKPFDMKPSIKVKYDKVYHHSFNEFLHIIIGDNSFKKFDENKTNTTEDTRVAMMQYGIDNSLFYNQNAQQYKALIEASEDVISNAMRMISPKVALGNLYQQSNPWEDIKNQAVDTYKNITDPYKNINNDIKKTFGFWT